MEDNLKNEEFEVVIEDDESIEDSIEEPIEEPIEESIDEPIEKPAEEAKTVPLTALQKEREKIRALKQEIAGKNKIIERVMQGSGARDPRELETRMDDITLRNYIEQQGMDENTARAFLMQQKRLMELELSKKDVEYKDEISKMKDNPFYADINEVSEDVIDYAKSKGLTAKEAYNALYGEQRAMELAKQKENEIMQEKKQEKKISALSSSGNAPAQKNTIKLTSKEVEWAKAAGMTPADYVKFKNMK